MCRLLAFALTEEFDVGYLLKLLVNASKREILASFKQHDDGWGYAVALKEDEWRLLSYKTRVPIWEDSSISALERLLRRYSIALGLVHTRKASKNTPVDTFSAHPFSFTSNDGSLVFFAQNGGIDKVKAYELLSNRVKVDLDSVSDTFIHAMLLREFVEKNDGKLIDGFIKLHELLHDKGLYGSCSNILILKFSPRDKVELLVARIIYGEARREYCELYEAKHGSGCYIIASSTLTRYDEGILDFAPLGKNMVVVYSLEDEYVSRKAISID